MLEINNLIMYDAVRPQWGFLGERLRALFIPQYKFAKVSSAVLLRKLVQNCTGIGEMDIVCSERRLQYPENQLSISKPESER